MSLFIQVINCNSSLNLILDDLLCVCVCVCACVCVCVGYSHSLLIDSSAHSSLDRTEFLAAENAPKNKNDV